MRQFISIRSSVAPSTSSAREAPWFVIPTSYQSTGNNYFRIPCAAPGKFKNLKVNLDTAPGAGKSWTFTLNKDASDTALAVTISDTNTEGSNTSDEVTVSLGSNLMLIITPSGTPTAMGQYRITYEFVGDNTNESIYGGWYWVPTATPMYAPTCSGHDTGSLSSTESYSQEIMPTGGTISKLYVKLSAGVGTGKSMYFFLSKNGVLQDGSGSTVNTGITISNSDTAGNSSFSLSISAGDLLSFVVGSGSHLNYSSVIGAGINFVSTVDNECLVINSARGAVSQLSDRYMPLSGANGISWQSGETSVDFIAATTTYTLKKLYVLSSAGPGAGKSYAVSIRRSASDPAGTPSVTLSGATTSTTTGSDTTNSVIISSTNTIAIVCKPTNVPGSAPRIFYGMVQILGDGTTPATSTFPALTMAI